MKVFYIGLIFAALALNFAQADLKERVEKLGKACSPESKATPEEVAKFFGNGMKAKDATDAVKCHIKCLMEKREHLKDGVLDQAHVRKLFDKIPALKDQQEDIAKAIAECSEQKGDNDCDSAAKILLCFNESEAGKKALSAV